MWIANQIKQFIEDFTDFPVLPTAATLHERFQQDRLGVMASSLTFTTTLSLVPFFAVVLSVFTAFPLFADFKAALERWLAESLIPASISSNVMDYLTQFASQARQLGTLGMAGLLVTALTLVLTIDHTLNDIWRVRRKRPLGQRVLVYWAALTLGPLLLGTSLAITSAVVSRSAGWFPALPGGGAFALGFLQLLLMTGGVTLLYRYVPNAPVKWSHALAGALFVALCLSVTRHALGIYLARVPTYSLMYGAFATLPILLLWIYMSWLIVLLGAVIAAYLPSLLAGVARRGDSAGWDFQLAIELLQTLVASREVGIHGLSVPQLAARLRVDALRLNPVLEALQAMDWVGQLAVRSENEAARHALLIDPANTPLAPLIARLLLGCEPAVASLWALQKGWTFATLQEALQSPEACAGRLPPAQP
ncbi:MAG: YihY family inner membrane protein [Burkholderiaceae bacterium]|jgi:membrane protein|nr:YihY family inner membrane protein [Burkholderiaceae bacterium]